MNDKAQCEACQADRPRGGLPEKLDASTWRTFCMWDNQGQHCRMKPTMMQQHSRQFCQWHYCVYYHATPNTLESFEGWTRYWWERRYCSLWTHYTVPYLWACVSGIEPPHEDPFACQQAGCDLRPDEPPVKLSPVRPALDRHAPEAGLLVGPVPLGTLVEVDPNAGW